MYACVHRGWKLNDPWRAINILIQWMAVVWDNDSRVSSAPSAVS